jgi:tripartite-type tricarboxylate transporter receptor subunit TctC
MNPIRIAVALAIGAILSSTVAAQDRWPVKPVRLVIGFPPGGAVDAMARTLAPALSAQLGQPVVVENRPGAGQAVGAEVLAKADPDGYTLGIIDSGPLTIAPHLRRMPYDATKSFRPIGSIANLPLVLVASRTTALKTIKDIEQAERAKPGSLSYASTGAGSIHNLIGEYLKATLKLQMEHVPYKGTAQALPDLLSGRVELMLAAVSSGARLVQDQQVWAVGVTSARPSPVLPGVPTLAEQGLPGFDAQGWVGLFAPAGTSDAVVQRASAALRVAMRDPAFIRQEVERGGNEMLQGTPEELANLLARDDARWQRVVREQSVGSI